MISAASHRLVTDKEGTTTHTQNSHLNFLYTYINIH